MRAFLEAPQQLSTALHSMASTHGFVESSMIALLTHGSIKAVQTLIKNPEKIVAALALFTESQLADSATIAQKLLRIMTWERPSIVNILIEAQEQLSHSITVLSQNNLTDPGMIILILERADDSVIRLMIHHPQKLVDIILSSVDTPDTQIWSTVLASADTKDIQTCTTVDLMIRIKVTSFDQQTHPHTHTPRLSHTCTHIFVFC